MTTSTEIFPVLICIEFPGTDLSSSQNVVPGAYDCEENNYIYYRMCHICITKHFGGFCQH